jgi:RNA-binding protein 26
MAFQAMQNFMSQFPMNLDMNTDKSRGRNNRKGGRGGRKGGARAPFSAEGPVLDRSKSTIVVESIPEEHFSEEEIREFFSQFGEIQEVSMQPYKRLAVVKYDNWGSANAAYKSHKAIFDNRFVKVFWYKDEQDASKQPGANGAKYHGDDGMEVDADAEPEIDPEEFRRRQEEAQQQFQEKEKKRAEIQRQRDELEQKQRELLDSHRQVTERLRSKLAEKNGGSGEGSAPATSAEALRATLADLESEAKMLGIDPDAVDETSSSYSSGRGGYGYRGRGSFPPRGRGFRGGGRGGYGGLEGRHAAYAQYSLDNRPKRLAITGVDFSVPDTDESLRHVLLVSTLTDPCRFYC